MPEYRMGDGDGTGPDLKVYLYSPDAVDLKSLKTFLDYLPLFAVNSQLPVHRAPLPAT